MISISVTALIQGARCLSLDTEDCKKQGIPIIHEFNIWISIQVCLMFWVSQIVFPYQSSPTTKTFQFIFLLISELCFLCLFAVQCSRYQSTVCLCYAPFLELCCQGEKHAQKINFSYEFLAMILIWTIMSLKWHSGDLLTQSNFFSLCPQFLPTWLAPNLITFTGFMFLVLNFLMLAFFDFDFTASGRFTLLVYFLIFLHTINWSSPPCGVKLPVLVLHPYKYGLYGWIYQNKWSIAVLTITHYWLKPNKTLSSLSSITLNISWLNLCASTDSFISLCPQSEQNTKILPFCWYLIHFDIHDDVTALKLW